MKTSKTVVDIPRGKAYLKVDVGNEFLYIWDIDNKSYVAVSHSVTGKVTLFKY